MENLQELLDQSAARHAHLCPRQVLGVRMGLLAGKVLNLPLPQLDKRLFAFVECDGCGMGGIEIATGCRVDRRTLRVMDYGKLAATFVDTQTGRSVRIKPHPACRQRAQPYAPQCHDSWHRQLVAYQVMPDEALFTIQPVQLCVSMERIISQPGLRAICEGCGEEITNQREVRAGGRVLCRACAGDRYYTCLDQPPDCGVWLSPAAGTPLIERGNGDRPIPVITVIGKSGAGKTTLLEKLVRELRARGYHLATVKHHSHGGFEIDVPGKDSWRFAQAGSHHVIVASPDKIASYRELDRELSLNEITAQVDGVDVVLVEGYKQANKPTLEVVRATNSRELIGDPEQRFAVVSDIKLNLPVPRFDLDDVPGIASLIEERFLSAGVSSNNYVYNGRLRMKMLQDVMASLPEGAVKDIHLGDHWTAVVAGVDGHLQCGLASNPAHPKTLVREAQEDLAEMARTRPARELCNLAFRQDLRLASVGVATINALLPRSLGSWVDCNAGQAIAHHGAGKRVALVGHFPFVPELRQQVGHLDVLELRPQPGDRYAAEAPEVIPQASVVAITSMTLINGTLEGLLELCSPRAFVVMLGPSTPLSPVLFDYGIDLLCGSVVENLEPVLQAIDEGKHFRQIQALGVRLVTIARDGAGGAGG